MDDSGIGREEQAYGERPVLTVEEERFVYMNATASASIDPHTKVHDLLKGFSTAMLITHDGTELRARPMAIAGLEADCHLWFISSRETAKIHEIEKDTHIQVVCQDDHSAYLSLSGMASLVDDRAKIRELWKETFKVWFPHGVEDPRIVLITVTPGVAEYWDNHGLNGVKYLFQVAKAYVTGTKAEIHESDQHGFVKL